MTSFEADHEQPWPANFDGPADGAQNEPFEHHEGTVDLEDQPAFLHSTFADFVGDTPRSLATNMSFHRFARDHATTIEEERVLTLGWKHLCVRAGGKELLHGASGQITGGMVAIMGPSGSGKSTLLNTLLRRLTTGLEMSGEVSLNGHPLTKDLIKRAVAYVMQDDVVSPLLTVRETVSFMCALRFHNTLTDEQQTARTNEVIELMTLAHCADRVILEGLSGGERKRLAIALELLTFPRILVLDEPTSALDSLDALELVRTLRTLVDCHGITVICTIHQPQYKVFNTFQRVILLSRGYTVYDGPIDGVPAFCERHGGRVEPGQNPADAVMNVATAMTIDVERLNNRSVPDFQHLREQGMLELRQMTPRYSQFLVLFRRGMYQAKRRHQEFLTTLIQTIINAFLVGLVFLNLPNTFAKSQTRMSGMFYCCINQGNFGAISSLNIFASERVLSLRDRSSGNYYAFPYYAAKMSVDLILRFPFPVLFTCIAYPLMKFESDAGSFFFFMFVMWLDNVAAISLATAVSAWFRLPEISSLALPLSMEIARLFGGFFVAPSDATPGTHWLNFISYLHYAYGAISRSDLDHRVFDGCNATVCQNGPQKIAVLGLDQMSKGEYVAGLIAFIVVCQIATYLGVRFVNW